MNIKDLFIKSLYSIKAISFFRFQKIEKTISYLFLLSFLVSLPTLILFFISLFSQGGIETYFEFSMMAEEDGTAGIIPVFIFLFILFTIIGISMVQFLTVSLLAAIGLLIKQWMKRKLDYKHLWNMSAYAVTLPAIIIGLSALLPVSLSFPAIIYFLLSLTILTLAVRKVPIPKK